jgi:lysophospholipase L1-like esterase
MSRAKSSRSRSSTLRLRKRWMRTHGLTAFAALLAVGTGIGVLGVALFGQTPAVSGALVEAVTPPASSPLLTLPAGAQVLIFGDSYTSGRGASTPEQGFAYKLAENEGWNVTVDGVAGTGYLERGPQRIGAYPTRMAELEAEGPFDLLIIQGSTNDFQSDNTRLPAAVTATIEAAETKFPGTPIVMVGPVTYGGSPARIGVDSQLSRAAAANDTIYLSPTSANWYTAGDRAQLRDEETGNPNDSGHQALADRLTRSFAALTS